MNKEMLFAVCWFGAAIAMVAHIIVRYLLAWPVVADGLWWAALLCMVALVVAQTVGYIEGWLG